MNAATFTASSFMVGAFSLGGRLDLIPYAGALGPAAAIMVNGALHVAAPKKGLLRNELKVVDSASFLYCGAMAGAALGIKAVEKLEGCGALGTLNHARSAGPIMGAAAGLGVAGVLVSRMLRGGVKG